MNATRMFKRIDFRHQSAHEIFAHACILHFVKLRSFSEIPLCFDGNIDFHF